MQRLISRRYFDYSRCSTFDYQVIAMTCWCRLLRCSRFVRVVSKLTTVPSATASIQTLWCSGKDERQKEHHG